jgi:hypothetical protein
MRSVPTCGALKIREPSDVSIPFFIKMNELPHMHDRSNNKTQLFVVENILQK